MPGLLRVRSGDYRVVYRVEDRELLVLVVARAVTHLCVVHARPLPGPLLAEAAA